jgi:acetyl-CoA C-acetyltransferase
MSRFTDLDPSTPVVVGVAELVHRAGPDFVSMSATDLMIDVARAALADSGVGGALGARCGEVLVPHGTWTENDPGRAVADAIGAGGARSIRSELGVLQHDLLVRAARGVVEGRFDAAIVVGGENRWSDVVASRSGDPVPDPPAVAVASTPDETIAPTDMVISQIEIERNLTTAAHQYAIIESAIRHDLGRTNDEHQRQLGLLWERFARVAAGAPFSWDTRSLSADEISVVSDTNRLIAAPYTKWLVSQWNIDQAAALVFTTVATARRLGIAEDRWVFPLAMVESNAVIPMPERAEIHRWPASRVCGATALECSGVSVDEIGAVDLYSCFPAAVQVQAHELGLTADRDLTVTGGMTFAGGPFNNYVLQGAAAMVRTLRSGHDGSIGLTSAVSGLLTKPAVTVWSTDAPRRPFAAIDVSAAAGDATERRVVDPDLVGAAVVAGATIVAERDGGFTTVAVLESVDGVRTVAQSRDRSVGESFLSADPVGRPVMITDPGEFAPA